MELSDWLVDRLLVIYGECLWGVYKSSVGVIYESSVNCLWGCDRPPFMCVTNLPSPCSSSPLKLI